MASLSMFGLLLSKESVMDKDVLVELVIVVIRVILENIR